MNAALEAALAQALEDMLDAQSDATKATLGGEPGWLERGVKACARRDAARQRVRDLFAAVEDR